MATTVIQHVLARLREIGIADVFGVPGDFSFPVCDAICLDPAMRWIGCCNELNAAYAADGYARIKGIGALCTTYGVGELSALAGIAGAYAEHLPLFHLVGMPGKSLQVGRALMHHTLGNGEYDLFYRMTQPVVCARAIMTPQNVVFETERLISEALYHRRPVYMAFPADLATQPVLGSPVSPPAPPRSDPASLEAATDAIIATLKSATNACILPDILVARAGLRTVTQSLIDASNLPFATMFMGKSVLDERQPNYMGMYAGTLMSEEVRVFVENCDCILNIGSLMTDFNTGAFTARIPAGRVIDITHHHVKVNGKIYTNIEIGDILATLARRLPKRPSQKHPIPSTLGAISASNNDIITAAALYPRWEKFLRKDDVLVAEIGTASMGMGFAHLPAGTTFCNQTLWGSIGWATPAAFGAAIAAPDRRLVLITGEGAHQLTVQEVSQFARFGLQPLIFVINNAGYLIERLLCKDPAIAYNDVAAWQYAKLPQALGCEGWFTARVATCAELDQALATASQATSGVYIEVVTDPNTAPPFAMKLHDSIQSLYSK